MINMMKMADQVPVHTATSGRVSILPPLDAAPRTCEKLPTFSRYATSMGSRATPRSARGVSRKLQDMLKRQQLDTTGPSDAEIIKVQKYEPKNWKHLSDKELKKMCQVERSRYLAYEPETKEAHNKRMESIRRVKRRIAAERENNQGASLNEMIESEWDNGLVGHLKSAEARQRLKTMKMCYEQHKVEELAHLIASQPSSLEAVRLETFLQPPSYSIKKGKTLSKYESERCENLLEDTKGLLIGRTL